MMTMFSMFLAPNADARTDLVSFAVPPRLVRPQDMLTVLRAAKEEAKTVEFRMQTF